MKRWIGPLLIISGGLGGALYRVHRAEQMPLPSYAGRLSDEVWAQTRTKQSTVAWYRACINQVAEEEAKRK